MVEKTNAAGASLAVESARLRELTAQFQLASAVDNGTASTRSGTSRYAA